MAKYVASNIIFNFNIKTVKVVPLLWVGTKSAKSQKNI